MIWQVFAIDCSSLLEVVDLDYMPCMPKVVARVLLVDIPTLTRSGAYSLGETDCYYCCLLSVVLWWIIVSHIAMKQWKNLSGLRLNKDRYSFELSHVCFSGHWVVNVAPILRIPFPYPRNHSILSILKCPWLPRSGTLWSLIGQHYIVDYVHCFEYSDLN